MIGPRRDRGSLSLQASALVLALSLIASTAVLLVRLATALAPAALPGLGEDALALVEEALSAWEGDASPQADSFHDQGMRDRARGDATLSVRDLSGSLSPDWCDPELFRCPSLSSYLVFGRGAGEISLIRDRLAPTTRLKETYGSCFSESAFDAILSAWAFPAPGAFPLPVHPFLRWAADLPERPAGAFALLSSLELAQSPADLPPILSLHDPAWQGWMPSHPPLNANSAAPALLRAILEYCCIAQPEKTAATLIALRQRAELGLPELALILGQGEGAGEQEGEQAAKRRPKATSLLGCRSLFREYSIVEGKRRFTIIAGRRPLPEGLGSPRILDVKERALP